jgi:hypothetical protein
MPRVFMILAGATLVVFAWLFYQYTAQQQEEAELIEYEIVLNEIGISREDFNNLTFNSLDSFTEYKDSQKPKLRIV